MKNIPFKVSARAARLIGRENVATSQGAVTELVKNAYDADAGACAIFFLRRHEGVPEQLSSNDFSDLKSALKNSDQFYSEHDGVFKLAANLNEANLEVLSGALDNVIDLWIVDNGKGMSSDVIEDYWMVIGTDAKEIISKSDGGRVLTGAKGIGRFALDRLGQECELYTANKSSIDVVHWVVDWGDFEGEGKIIDDVTAILETEQRSYPDVLSEIGLDNLLPDNMPARDDTTTPLSFLHGTTIGIRALHDVWDQRDSLKLKETLEALLPPKDRGDFNIYVFDHRNPDASGWIDNFPPDQFDYKLHATVAKDGAVSITVDRQEIDANHITPTFFTLPGMENEGYRKEDFEQGQRSYKTSIDDLVSPEDGESEADLLSLGPFDFTLYYFKLSNPTAANLKRFPQKTFDVTKRRNWLKASGGIRLYRDEFRVRPYGEPNTQGSDWLLLGQRTAQNPEGVADKRGNWRVPPQQVAGTIHISKEHNPLLADQSNREGIMNERAFSLFRRIVLSLIREFEKDRSYLFYHFDQAFELDNPDEGTLEEGKKLAKDLLASGGKTPKTGKTSGDEVPPQDTAPLASLDPVATKTMAEALDISERKNEALKDDIQVLRGMATLGTVLVSFTHELKQIKANMGSRQQRMEKALDRVVDMEKVKSLPEPVDPYNILKRWGREDEKVSRWVDFALSSVSPAKRRRGPISWQSYLKNLKAYWAEFLADRTIILDVPKAIEGNPHVLAHEIDLDSIFFNLIINSFEAFSFPSEAQNREIKIEIVGVSDDKIQLTYSDNGPGIASVFNVPDDIFLYGVTSKREAKNHDVTGTGIGMWLVNSIFKDYGGEVEVLSRMGEPGFRLALSLPLYVKQDAQ